MSTFTRTCITTHWIHEALAKLFKDNSVIPDTYLAMHCDYMVAEPMGKRQQSTIFSDFTLTLTPIPNEHQLSLWNMEIVNVNEPKENLYRGVVSFNPSPRNGTD